MAITELVSSNGPLKAVPNTLKVNKSMYIFIDYDSPYAASQVTHATIFVMATISDISRSIFVNIDIKRTSTQVLLRYSVMIPTETSRYRKHKKV